MGGGGGRREESSHWPAEGAMSTGSGFSRKNHQSTLVTISNQICPQTFSKIQLIFCSCILVFFPPLGDEFEQGKHQFIFEMFVGLMNEAILPRPFVWGVFFIAVSGFLFSPYSIQEGCMSLKLSFHFFQIFLSFRLYLV